ncbi:hypothetical protein E2K93_02375 [Thalassotalea sp. HSM 43]|uniref:hypothetical protein n=1 Tax=Thalassotalea sp. HSM 43 TaxID=2552945 RepID=UPI001080F350|nr:hypothetical protein [Thalassotalea sp. HSM 43]QBY03286.1 hypothetical protein E2K93_02375 [Thalassotalea sp. HSM 43]
MSFWQELKRRNVVKVAVAYLALAWLVLQVTSIVVPAFELPEQVNRIVIFIGLIGFPFAIFFAWAYELTPGGLKKTTHVSNDESITNITGRRLDFIIIGLLSVTLLFVVWDNYWRSDSTESVQSGEASSKQPAGHLSIAVLPLTNLSSYSDNEFFTAGIHEEILTELSFIDGLRVASRTSSLKYVQSALSLTDIGKELNVRYIVEGSVRRINDNVRITIQLIDATTDAHLWATNYDRKLDDIFTMQSAVAKEIKNSIQLEIQPTQQSNSTSSVSTNAKALTYYQRAQSIEASERETEESLQRTKRLLELAVKEDPEFADAWGLLNEVCDHMRRTISMSGWYENDEDLFAELTTQAKYALDKAVSLAPDNLEVLLAQASDYVAEENVPDFQDTRKVFIDRAIELYPDAGMPVYVLAWWYQLNGQLDNATKSFKLAVEKDPFNARILQGAHIFFSFNTTCKSQACHDYVDTLYNRLADSVGGVTPLDTLGRLKGRFYQSGDASVFDELKQKQGDEFILKYGFDMLMLNSVMQTPIAVFLPYQEQPEHVTFDNEWALANHTFINVILLEHYVMQQDRSNIEKATKRLAFFQPQTNPEYWGEYWYRLHTQMSFALGDLENARENAQYLVDNRDKRFDPHGLDGIVAMAYVDADKAAELFLAEAAKYPNWLGADILAIDTRSHWRLLVHPKIIEYYVAHGKWIPYLAERLSVYEGLEIRD